MSRLDHAYRRIPVPAQHAAVTAYGLWWRWARFGPGYRAALAEFERRERWTVAEWEAWMAVQVTEVLAAAAERVPHYREAFRSHDAEVRHGRLEGLPLLDKDALRRDPDAFVDPGVPARHPLVFHTSGSTGTPIATRWTVAELRASMAVREARSARWAGVSFSQARATFSGRLAVTEPDSEGPFHRYNAAERQVYLSPFHLRPDTAAAYERAMDRHRVIWGTGYAVSFYLLAKHLTAQEVQPHPLRAVITTSEKLTEAMRATIGRAFSCNVYEEYGTVENASFASECEAGSLHVSPDVGVVEILRPDGSPCDPGEPGEVVATTLMRRLQPLVRYRLGDIAAWAEEPCRCGRALPVLAEVVGRVEDVVRGPDARELLRFHGIFVGLPAIREGQIVQVETQRFVVRLVMDGSLDQATRAEVVARMHARLGAAVVVDVEGVERIERTANGKFRAVISVVEPSN